MKQGHVLGRTHGIYKQYRTHNKVVLEKTQFHLIYHFRWMNKMGLAAIAFHNNRDSIESKKSDISRDGKLVISLTFSYVILTLYDPKDEGFRKHCGQRKKCYQHVLFFPAMFSTLPKTNFDI